jgi:putative dehydrogenase
VPAPGISPGMAIKALASGAGGSRMLQVRRPMMENAGWDHATMKVRVWQKDMQLIAQALADTGAPAPLFAATVPLYNAAMGMGHEEHDTAAVFDVLQQMSAPPVRRAASRRSRPRSR